MHPSTPPLQGESPRAEVGEIDTRAPFASVKAAVSLFGEVAIPSDRSSAVKKTKAPQTEVSFSSFFSSDLMFHFPKLFALHMLLRRYLTLLLEWNFLLEQLLNFH